MAMSASNRVVDATQGFGHFYFAPPYFTRGYRPSPCGQRIIKAHRERKGIRDPSLPPFPFMKLPLEIRHMIYKLLLAPLAEDRSGGCFREEFSGVTMGQGIRFKVFEPYYDYTADTTELWQRPDYEVEIKEVRVLDLAQEDSGCPAHDSQLTFDGTCYDLDMNESHTIHRLSHVSRHFTSELGECLWGNAIINLQCPELFFDFFEDRPQIWKHVNGISLLIYSADIDDSVTFGALLLRISKFVSQNLDLRVFSVRIFSYYRRLSRFEGLKKWITAFRGLKVGERFSVHVDAFARVPEVDLSRKLYDLWLPDTLRVAQVKA